MKVSLVVLSMLVSSTAFAGDWMFSSGDSEVAQSQPAPVQVRKPDAVKKDAKKEEPKAKTDGAKKKCTASFADAAAFVKETYGNDADIGRLGQFDGSYKDMGAQNQFKNSGGRIFLNMVIGGMITTDVPVVVCPGKPVKVTLSISKASDPTVQNMVASKQAPKSITLSISRVGNSLKFRGNANGTTVTASAALR